MSQRDPRVPLQHMLDHARKTLELVRGKTRPQVESDEWRVLSEDLPVLLPKLEAAVKKES